MNKLRDWRRQNKFTLEALAEQLGVATGSLSRIERLEQWPDREFFRRVSVLTRGTVTANDFLQEKYGLQYSAETLKNGGI